MRNVRRGIFVAGMGFVLSAAVMIASAVYGISGKEIAFTNKLKTGSVDLMIEQYEMTSDGMRPVQPGQVLANQDVSYIPKITNLRAGSYVRVKADIIMDREIPEPVTVGSIYGLGKGWVRRGDYFYYTEPMKHMESAYLFRGIHVPIYWYTGTASGFRVVLTADAIQAYGFDPDFSSEMPWGTVEVQEAKVSDSIVYRNAGEANIDTGQDSKRPNILRITGDTELESNTGDLFRNFGYFMAGTVCEDSLQIKNDSRHPVRVSFCTENYSGTLAEGTNLEIYCNGEVMYRGPLSTVPIYRYTELAEIPAGKLETMEFEVTLPKAADNELSVMEDQVVWKFRVEELDDGRQVQTGDETELTVFFIAALLAAVSAAAVLISGKRGKKDEKSD